MNKCEELDSVTRILSDKKLMIRFFKTQWKIKFDAIRWWCNDEMIDFELVVIKDDYIESMHHPTSLLTDLILFKTKLEVAKLNRKLSRNKPEIKKKVSKI